LAPAQFAADATAAAKPPSADIELSIFFTLQSFLFFDLELPKLG
jgi:hypothetical protein